MGVGHLYIRPERVVVGVERLGGIGVVNSDLGAHEEIVELLIDATEQAPRQLAVSVLAVAAGIALIDVIPAGAVDFL
ncbi:hypothetical protein D7X96_03415 [Corallococcus interemptor]|uniref:Uncharacterized protein n=1 Tax=Corallococcus interemptor TaxID=2316720 RepID=A0A3A8R777_9BACT|nr:hypothetical protein D7X96_03415 [Corallococcus interemptor]